MLVSENLSGQSLKGYDLSERIGAGAYGAVYRAYQSTVGREVAIKVILPGFANQPDFIRRFEMEAQLVARLEHIHIVPLYDYWRDLNGAYLVMRWLRGGSLRQTLREAPYDLASAVRVIDQVSSGLAAAHHKDIVHRDLKPSNILLDEEGNAYLADFGIARDLTLPPEAGQAIVGSPAYLAPEQIRRELVSPQTDIYNLGVVLYELLTGVHPFQGTSPVEMLYHHLNDPLPLLDNLDPDLLDGINAIIQKATHKNPRQRFKDVLEMAAALRQAANLADSSRDTSLLESLTRREQEILSLIVAGRSNKQIAQDLFVELSTVKWYITQIYAKLNVRSRMQAIVRARELQFVLPGQENGNGAQASSIPTPALALGNPYKGLRAFEAADSRDFFGREALIARLVARLEEAANLCRFLAIIGPSGCGKSSLVKAGLIPALRRGELPGSDRWFVVEMTPGEQPLDGLEVALSRVAADQEDNIRPHLERDTNGLLRAASLILPQDGSELLLVIDQFEELFSSVQDEELRSHFLDLITSAVSAPESRVRVVITLRADFYDRPLQYPGFGELVRRRMETVLPLSAEELERAILRPADRAQVKYEPGLAATIIEDVRYQPGALPLLQYALAELFDHRQDTTLTHQAYAQIGGAVGALAKRAEQIYEQQSQEGRDAARQLFLRLVSIGAGESLSGDAAQTQRRVTRADILAITDDPELMDELIDTFAAYRLLSLDHDPATRKPTVQLAHEAILREWERLRSWIEQSREDLLQHRRLRVLTREWLSAGQDEGYLLREARLEQFSAWAATSSLKLAPDEISFLQRSQAAKQSRQAEEEARRQRELDTTRKLAETERQRADDQARTANRLRRWAVYLAIALLAATGLAVASFLFLRQAQTQRRLAFTRELAAAAVSNLDRDPELSLLLALQAAGQTTPQAGNVLPEVEDALHRSLQADRLLLSIPHGGALAVSPDGTHIATGGEDGTIKIWDASTGDPILAFAAHTGFISDMKYSPDGLRILSGSMDGTLKLWDARSGQLLRSISPGAGSIYSVAYSPDGSRILAGMLNLIVTWDAATGDELSRFADIYQCGMVGDMAFTHDGKQLGATLSNGCSLVLDSRSGEILLSDRDSLDVNVSGVAFSPSGSRLALPGNRGDGEIRNVLNTTGIVYLYGHTGEITDLEFSPDGQTLATSSEDGTARVWDSSTGKQLAVLAGHHGRVNRLAFFPDGRRLATTGKDGTTRVWDVSPGGSHEWLTIGDPSNRADYVAISPDGRYLATNDFYRVGIYDAASGMPVSTLELGEHGRIRVDFSSQPDRIASTYDYVNAGLHNIATGKVLVKFSGHGDELTALALSPGGDRLAAGDNGGLVTIWDASNGKELASLQAHTASILDLEYSRDGSQLASSSDDGRVILWDLASGKPRLTLVENQPPVVSLSYSPDGMRLVTSGADGKARVWDTTTGQLLQTLVGHTGAITSVEYSPDGRRIATASVDSTARLWDAASAEELLTLAAQKSEVTGVAFYPDGKRLATSSADGTVRVYALDLQDLISLAHQRLTRSLTLDECRQYLHDQQCPAG